MIHFLKNIFQTERLSDQEGGLSWVNLQSPDQLAVLDDTSYHHTQVIFKHSTSCGISGMIKRSFQNRSTHPAEGITYYLLDLLRYRELSSAIADKYGIRHESPQVLVIRDGVVVAHGSHHDVSAIDLNEWV